MSGDDSMTPSERRLGVRHFACFPAHLARSDDRRRMAMINDLSLTGAMLAVRGQLEVGDHVALALYTSGDADAPARAATAQVVRVEPLDAGSIGLWTHRVAVHFDEPLTGFEAEIAALEQRQRDARLV